METVLQNQLKHLLGQRISLDQSLMTRLPKSILQEAIQGHLVPQDPNDEPASVLLNHIREEKQKLLKEGKLKKKDIVDSEIFKGEDNKYYEKIGGKVLDISEEVPFDIPESWLWVRLASIANLYTGDSISETEKRAKYQRYRERIHWDKRCRI